MKVTRAFTLIELLVVIGIIALLVAILLPALARARRISRKVVCATQLKTIGTGIAAYLTDCDDVYPYLGELKPWQPETMPVTPEQMLNKYVNVRKTWQCPSDEEPRRLDWYVWRSDSDRPCPWPEDVLKVSYTWSEHLLRGFINKWQPIPADKVEHPGQWGMLSEGRHIFNGWYWETLARDNIWPDVRLDQTHVDGKDECVNVLFGDSHVEPKECNIAGMRNVESAPYED